MKKGEAKFMLAVLLSGILWGTMGYFRRNMGEMGLDTFGIVLVRCGFAALLFALLILIKDPSSIRVKWKDCWVFLGSGVFSLLFFMTCYFQAMTLMSLSAAAILLYTAPVFVMLMSALLFRETVTGRKILAIVLAFGGCCLVSGITGGIGKVSGIGLLYGLGSGIGYALYSIFGKLAFARGYKSNTVNFWSCLLAAIGAAVITGLRTPLEIVLSGWGNFGFCLAAAAVTTFFPYLLYTYGLTGMEAGAASVVASVEPVVATLVGAVLYHETITPASALGICLVLTAIVLLSIKRRRAAGE